MYPTAAVRPQSVNFHSSVIAALLVAVWLAAVAWLLWYFEVQRIANEQQLFHFDSQNLPPPPAASVRGAKALYLLTGNCRCSAAALAEIAHLQRVAGARLNHFVIADEYTSSVKAVPSNTLPLTEFEQANWRAVAPRTSAVALWDERGTLVYFGPIASSVECGAERNYLLSAWQQLAAHQARVFLSRDVVACACSSRNAA